MAEERIQRRLAAILAADVVGYSRLMGADEAGTLARLKALRRELLNPKVSEYGGRIVKTTGDGTLIEFPSAVDAVNHAIDVQRSMGQRNADEDHDSRMDLRIGINVGDVIVDGDDIYGDGVNVAARLEALAEPGGICVSGTVYDQVRGKLDVPFHDLGEQSLKNIVEPVRVITVTLEASTTTSATASFADAIFRRPAVAVLPFENMSTDPDQEFFGDGLTEDIITALSLWRSFPVIARNSTFAYKGTSPDIRRVGEELGARYVVEGSVRKAGNRVRVTFQLINAATGHHVWAEKLDRDLEDIFSLQDEISDRIAGTVAPEVDRVEQTRSRAANPANLNAWEFYQRGRSLSEEFTKEANGASREMYEKAIELDPSYSAAYAQLALTHHLDLYLEVTQSRENSLSQLLQAARAAITIDDSDFTAHFVLSLGALWVGEHARALSEAQKSFEHNPSSIEALFACGAALDFSGKPDEALPLYERALQLSPRHPRLAVFSTMLARAQLNARQHEASANTATKAIESRPDLVEPHLILASCLAHLDRQPEAAEIYQAAKRLRPQGVDLPASWSRYAEPANLQHLLEGLGKAGWDG